MKAKREYWNYSIDCRPDQPDNMPSDPRGLHSSRAACVRDCKKFCRSEGVEYDDAMVAQITAGIDKTQD